MLDVIRAPGAARWWGEYEGQADDDELLAGWVIEIDGGVAGWLGFTEEAERKYPSVGLDIMLAPELHGNGYGPEALRLAIDHFIAKGHHRFTIDPAAANAKAIHAYEAVGFKVIGVTRKSELGIDGRWHDGLMMDLLAEEIAESADRA